MSGSRFALLFTAAFAVGASGLAAQAPASKYAAVLGQWEMTTQGRGGPQTQTFAFTVDGQALAGTVTGPQGATALAKISFDAGTLKFDVVREFNGNSVTQSFTATVTGNEMKGTMTGGGGGGRGGAGGGGAPPGGGAGGAAGGGGGAGGRGGAGGPREFTATRKP